MIRIAVLFICLTISSAAVSGERISGTNSYVLNQEMWHAGNTTYWRQDNNGTFAVSEGPIDPGFVRCIGAGFGGPDGVRGEGICIFGEGEDTFTWSWQAHKDQVANTWQVIDSTGKYQGMTGSGTSITRIDSEYQVLQHRVTDWEGEIELPQ